MYTSRTWFGDVFSEFFAPARVRKLVTAKTEEIYDDRGKVVIILNGLPSMPGNKTLMEFFMKKGYWVFMPRYRGTWESKGELLSESPEKDVAFCINGLSKGFTDAYSKVTYYVIPKKLYIIGSSFGGTAAILSLKDERIDKAVAFSPVIDWTKDSKTEPLDWLYDFTKQGFGEGYRVHKKNWSKLKKGNFYSPLNAIKHIHGHKLLLISAKDDEIVPYRPTVAFAKKINADLILKARGGHLSSSEILKPAMQKKIFKFLSAKMK